jgi:hypothetical protein
MESRRGKLIKMMLSNGELVVAVRRQMYVNGYQYVAAILNISDNDGLVAIDHTFVLIKFFKYIFPN